MKLIGVWVDEDNPWYVNDMTRMSQAVGVQQLVGGNRCSWINILKQPFLLLAVVNERGRIYPFQLLIEPEQHCTFFFEQEVNERVSVEVDDPTP
jgi:hypothetical protein